MAGRKAVYPWILLFCMVLMLTGCAADPYRMPVGSAESSALFGKSDSIRILLEEDDNFTFVTSRTEAGEPTKAFVFSTKMSVPEAAKYISQKRKPFETSDMNNQDSIFLTYDDEYAIVYAASDENDKGETMVQASTRKYVYRNQSRGLFNPYRRTVIIPYPAYYGQNWLGRDRQRYQGSTSTKGSIRSGSKGSISNRGGGTGFGK